MRPSSSRHAALFSAELKKIVDEPPTKLFRPTRKLNEAVMFKLTIDRVDSDWESENYSDDATFSAELKKIVDEPARIKTNKNYGGDINPNA